MYNIKRETANASLMPLRALRS